MSTCDQLPIDAFPAWAHLNHLSFKNVKLQHVGGDRGLGLLAEIQIAGGGQDDVILRVPHDLVLSAEAIDAYAKVDQNFKQLLEKLGRKVRTGTRQPVGTWNVTRSSKFELLT